MGRYQTSKKFEKASMKALPKALQKGLRILPASKPQVSNVVKKAIDRAINKQLETKVAVREVFKTIAVPGSGLDTAAGLGLSTTTGIIPLVPRGTDDASRVGDEITTKKLLLKFSLRARDITVALGNNYFKQPFLARVIVYNHRYAIDDYAATNIIDKGASYGNLDSSPDSWLEPYNKKEYKIWFSKTYKMAPIVNGSSGATVIDNMPNGYQCMAVGRKVIKLPKKLFFNGSATSPTNSMPQLAVAVCNIDGSIITNAQFRCEINCETQLYFTDS